MTEHETRDSWRRNHRGRMPWIAAVVALLNLLTPLPALALKLGGLSLVSKPAHALNARVSTAPAFFLSVGGVALSQVATSKDGLRVTDVRYDDAEPDGQRLRVDLKDAAGKTVRVRADVPDWILLPTVKFAASEEHGCVTLFGSLQDAEQGKAARDAGAYIANYHPAFANTLLGLRLLQADMLIMTAEAADLPSEDGAYVLGAGEHAPALEENQRRYSAVRDWIERQPVKFSSYVVGDHNRKVQFSAKSGRLVLTGEPYWRAWRHDPKQLERLELVRQELLIEGLADSMQLSPQQLEAKYTEEYMRARATALERKHGVSREPKIEQLPKYSSALTAQISANAGINPAVYTALRHTMRLSAFLRHVKAARPDQFQRLVQQVEKAKNPGFLDTPTVIGGL